MKPWMKVVIGCFAAAVIAMFLFVAGVVGLGYWAKNKVEEVTGGGPAVEEARRAANAVPFSRPEGGVIAEERLVKFIEVRASVYSVYEKYRGEIETRVAKVKEGRPLDFGDISTGLTFMGELQKAESLALAREAMPESEYAFITAELYKSMWADLDAGAAGKKAIREAAQAAKGAAAALKAAEGEGMPPEAREALAKAQAEITASTEEAAREIDNIGTARENVALFKKYEADLKKYAMPSLEYLFTDSARPSPTPGRK